MCRKNKKAADDSGGDEDNRDDETGTPLHRHTE
jgi:hypothetical protein